MPDIVAETERLVLRGERPGDLEVWLEHMNTHEVMARIGGVRPREKVVETFARRTLCEKHDLPFPFIALKADGTLIGKCGLARVVESGAPEVLREQVQIGWTLRADYWGRGYAREAAEAMLALGFGPYGLASVFGQTSESNEPSWRLMERLGMGRLAELDYPDPDYPPEDNPTKVYGLTRDAWIGWTEAVAHA